jgi:hypothetical protein
MKKWAKTKEGTKNPSSSFHKFAYLLLDRYAETLDKFGQLTVSNQGFELSVTEENITNILLYAALEVFVCAEQIINSHKRSLLDYCIYHRELDICDTYEHYIHLVACHCLVHCNYLAPGIKYQPVEFYSVNQDYNNSLFEAIVKKTDDSGDAD